MGKLVVALLVAGALAGPARAEGKPAVEPTAGASRESPPAAPAKAAGKEKPAGEAKGSKGAPAAAPVTTKPEGDGAGQVPCEPVKPCPIDG